MPLRVMASRTRPATADNQRRTSDIVRETRDGGDVDGATVGFMAGLRGRI
ncbi:hypothetical protein ATCC27039_02570 [Actinomyces naeslundii]|nr:hypothetical protein ATCC27039_02570 [Actinomyces naeslundii]